jgi:hypothetical protein
MGFKLGILRLKADERVVAMGVSADVKDGRSYPCASRWGTLTFPRYSGTTEPLEIDGGEYGVPWPVLDKDRSTEGLLRGLRHRTIQQLPRTSAIAGPRVCDKVFATPCGSSFSAPALPAPFWQNSSNAKGILFGAVTVTPAVRATFWVSEARLPSPK